MWAFLSWAGTEFFRGRLAFLACEILSSMHLLKTIEPYPPPWSEWRHTVCSDASDRQAIEWFTRRLSQGNRPHRQSLPCRDDEVTMPRHGYQRISLPLWTRPKNRTIVSARTHVRAALPRWPCLALHRRVLPVHCRQPPGKASAHIGVMTW
jgi:hypothetical protein